jgi:hypothetical protein
MNHLAHDHDSDRVTAVIQAIDGANILQPTVQSVSIDDDTATVCLVGLDGLRTTVQLRRDSGRWRVA